MLYLIAIFDFVVGFAGAIGIMLGLFPKMPFLHRLPVALICAGLMSQLAIDIGGVDRVQYPLWALKDIGLCGLLIVTYWSALRDYTSQAGKPREAR